jgi:hypothetical protein
MKMLGARQIAILEPTRYASAGDFCQIFEKDMKALYLLSLLLTADHSLAEKCFVRGLDDSGKGNLVFKQWAQSWARRTIIQNAIQIIRPRPGDSRTSKPASDRVAGQVMIEPAEIGKVAALPAFERFAFVMSVLERYSDQECSLLLDCTRGEVAAARTRALQQFGRSSSPAAAKLAHIGSDEPSLGDDPRALEPDVISRLAASA